MRKKIQGARDCRHLYVISMLPLPCPVCYYLSLLQFVSEILKKKKKKLTFQLDRDGEPLSSWIMIIGETFFVDDENEGPPDIHYTCTSF